MPPALRRWVARTLRVGVIVSAALLAVGLAELALNGTFSGRPVRLSDALGHLGGGFSAVMPEVWLLGGVLALLLTPFARVLLSAAMFGTRRDVAFTGITLFVLLVLVASILVGVPS